MPQRKSPAQLDRLTKIVDEFLNGSDAERVTGFQLLVFPYGEPIGARCQCFGNKSFKPEDLASLLREMAARIEGQNQQPEGRA